MAGNKHFIRDFLIPMMTVIGITLIALFAVFLQMVIQQNELSSHRERSQIEIAVNAKVQFLTDNLRDYSRWSESVEHLTGEIDVAWANDNIGPYLFLNKGYRHTFIIDRGGKTLYASDGPNLATIDARSLLGADFAPVLAKLERAPDGVEERFGQIVEADGQPAIVAASAILPNIGEDYAKPFGRRYMLLVQHIDGPFLQGIAKNYDMADLGFHRTRPQYTASNVSLKASGGREIGFLQWKPVKPGDKMRSANLPWLLIIAFLATILTISMLRRAAQATSDLAAGEASARHLANHDTLTGLANRRALRELGICQPTDVRMAVVFLDLDGFKEVNDLFGHQAGDQLLKEAALRLRKVVGDRGMLARVGGDEFSILLTSPDAHLLAAELAPQIVKVMSKPFSGNEIAMVVSASIGIALGRAGQSVDDLSRHADVAMYAAKAAGKNCWRVYDPEMDEGREIRKLLESELRDAVAAGEIDVMFQPIVEAREGAVSSVEALARWTSPTQGPVGPAIFIPIAEESGLIVKLAELVLRKACMAARDWGICLSVNISPAQFWHQSLVEDILTVLAECNFPPDRLELEITEGYLLSRPDVAADVIHRFRANGIRIALDDFGTGFASIGYLRRFELDRLKLDRSFVESVDTSPQSAEVAKAVIGLSHALDLPITAEGVETSPQALFMMLAGCERLQGWHYGKAVPAEDIAAMLVRSQVIEAEPVRMGVA